MEKGSIIILGANPTSEALVTQLNANKHRLFVIDEDASTLDALQSRHDIQTILGRPSYPDIMEQAEPHTAKAIIAMTDSDEVNLIACQVGHSLFQIKHKIACVQSPHYVIKEELFNKEDRPINQYINLEQSIYDDIKDLIKYPSFNYIASLSHEYVATSITMTEDHPFMHSSLDTISKTLPYNTILAGLMRQGSWVRFRTNIKFALNDQLLMLSHKDQLPLLSTQPPSSNKLMILGISHFTGFLCKHLSDLYDIQVIDPNRKKCHQLSSRYPDIIVLNGDPQDQVLLLNQNIDQCNMVIAASSDDEDNLIYSFHASDCGAKRIFTLINHIRQGHIFDNSPIDYTILAPQIVSDEIIRNLLLPGNTLHFYTKPGQIQITEIHMHTDHPYTGKKIRDLTLPKEVYIGGIIRDQELLFTKSTTEIQPNDCIVVYGPHQQRTSNPLEKMFLEPNQLFKS